MEVAAACVTANYNQLHSGSSGVLEETESNANSRKSSRISAYLQ